LRIGIEQVAGNFITPDSASFYEKGIPFDGGVGIVESNKQGLLRLSSIIDVDNNPISVSYGSVLFTCTVNLFQDKNKKLGCVGAIITYLRRKRAFDNPYLEQEEQSCGVLELVMWSITDSM